MPRISVQTANVSPPHTWCGWDYPNRLSHASFTAFTSHRFLYEFLFLLAALARTKLGPGWLVIMAAQITGPAWSSQFHFGIVVVN